jgi:hypothetical protein
MNTNRPSLTSTPGWHRALRILSVAAVATVAVGVQTALTAPASAPSAVVTVDPARILDTREPIGVPAAAPVGPDSSITVQVAGQGGVPADATGVVLTLTAADATVDTFITATPTGTPRATTSVLNPTVSKAIANTITVALGAGGQIDLYNRHGDVHLIADVTGYLVPQSSVPITPRVETGAIELTAYGATGSEKVGLPSNYGCVNLLDDGEMFLDVPLEHGSAVTSVTFRYYDNDVEDITFELIEINDVNHKPTTDKTLADSRTVSNSASGHGRVTITPAGADKVSGDVRYVINVYTSGQEDPTMGLHYFCGATVEYVREIV